MMKILVACEESQAVTKAMRARGHEAYSCDILECSGGHPEWHLQEDVLPLLWQTWDLVIAFPPCTDLAVSGAKHFAAKRADGRQQMSIDFFLAFTRMQCPWAIENPVGIMSTEFRKPDQIIQPWQFGHEATKTTCLWLNKLPKLVPTSIVGKGARHVTSGGNSLPTWYSNLPHSPKRARLRSRTFQGIADAMAGQWG